MTPGRAGAPSFLGSCRHLCWLKQGWDPEADVPVDAVQHPVGRRVLGDDRRPPTVRRGAGALVDRVWSPTAVL